MYDGLKNLEVPRRPRKKRGGGSRHPFLRKVGVVGLIFTLFAGAGLYVTYTKVKANLDKGKDKTIQELEQHLPDQPLNILVLGSDRRDVIEGGDRNKRQFKGDVGQRADVMILVHIAAKAEKAVLVSLPRDLKVDIPGYGSQKLNAAYAFGGPNLTLKTVKQFTGIPINHYVEINFASFQNIVDAVGGVDVFVDRPLQDRRSGLDIPRAGCVHLDGDMALSFVRARYIDPTADIGRIQRQQLFIRTLLRKVKSIGFLLNPAKWLRLSEAIGEGVKYDEGVGLDLARAVANKLAGFDQARVDFRIVPNYSALIGGVSYLVPVEDEARPLFNAIRDDLQLPDVGKTSSSVPKPPDVTVRILNGSAKGGLAGREQTRLSKAGFRIHSIGNAKSRTQVTTILYEFGDELKANLLAKQYPGSRKRLAEKDLPGDIVLTLGVDHAERVAARERGETPSPQPKPPVSEQDEERSACG
jgi:LCP family protein required for cell wall assembly